MRVLVAALSLICCVFAFKADAHEMHHARGHHQAPVAAQMLAQGLIHMLRSMPKEKKVAYHARHHVKVARVRSPSLDGAFMPFEPGPFSAFFGAGQQAFGAVSYGIGAGVKEVYRATSAALVTVQTAAGIAITVAPDFAPKIEGFIRDVVSIGYRPKQIHCYARGGHVSHSLHYVGEACDFDQRGWGKTAGPMYRVREIASRWGLRDGCEFRDCGHIDAGLGHRRYASAR